MYLILCGKKNGKKTSWSLNFLSSTVEFFCFSNHCVFFISVSYFTLVCFVFFCSKLKSPIKSSPIGSCTGRTHENHDISMEHGNLMVRKVYSDTILVSLPVINVKDFL